MTSPFKRIRHKFFSTILSRSTLRAYALPIASKVFALSVQLLLIRYLTSILNPADYALWIEYVSWFSIVFLIESVVTQSTRNTIFDKISNDTKRFNNFAGALNAAYQSSLILFFCLIFVSTTLFSSDSYIVLLSCSVPYILLSPLKAATFQANNSHLNHLQAALISALTAILVLLASTTLGTFSLPFLIHIYAFSVSASGLIISQKYPTKWPKIKHLVYLIQIFDLVLFRNYIILQFFFFAGLTVDRILLNRFTNSEDVIVFDTLYRVLSPLLTILSVSNSIYWINYRSKYNYGESTIWLKLGYPAGWSIIYFFALIFFFPFSTPVLGFLTSDVIGEVPIEVYSLISGLLLLQAVAAVFSTIDNARSQLSYQIWVSCGAVGIKIVAVSGLIATGQLSLVSLLQVTLACTALWPLYFMLFRFRDA